MFDDEPILKPKPVAMGNGKISGGAQQWGIPNALFTATGTSALAAGEVCYIPMLVRDHIKLTAWELEVTAAPAGAANLSVGVYRADADLQPFGAPLYDSGSVAVAGAFTGIKSATGLSIDLPFGIYLIALNSDTIMTLRSFTSGTPIVIAALGASPFGKRFSKTVAQGAFPTPGTPWDTISASAGGQQNLVVWQWSLA